MADGLILCSICGTSDVHRGSSITIENRRGTVGTVHRQQYDFCPYCTQKLSLVNLNAETGSSSLSGRVAVIKAKRLSEISSTLQQELPLRPT